MNIRDFFSNRTSDSNHLDQIRQNRSNKEQIIHLPSDSDNGEDKENRKKEQHHQKILRRRMRIGGVVAKLTPAPTRKNGDIIDLTECKKELELDDAQSDLDRTLTPLPLTVKSGKSHSETGTSQSDAHDYGLQVDAEARERKIMEAHGFYSNAAICVPNWTNTSQEAVRRLESEEFTVEIGGKREFKRFYGGHQFSDSFAGSKRNRRKPRCSISSDEEISEYLQPQTDDNQWVVEKVLSRRTIMEAGQRVTQYYLKWQGWSYVDSSWEPYCKENDMDGLIRAYQKRVIWKEAIAKMIPPPERNYHLRNYMNNSFLRCHQWEDEMNKIIADYKHKQAPLFVENWVDSQACPKDFEFILQNIFTHEAEHMFPGIQSIEHCKCSEDGKDCGGHSTCCAKNLNQNHCYQEDGRLNPRQVSSNQHWIIECTDACTCDINCSTRVVQRGRQIPLIIFRTLDRGWAIRTPMEIPKHTFICEYVGQVMTIDEASSSTNTHYQFDMDGCGVKDMTFIVDAAKHGNEARFVNHSCNPNLIVRPVFADRLDRRYHRIVFFSKKDIKQGEELTIDYCAIDQFAKGHRKQICQCKSKMCKGYYYY